MKKNIAVLSIAALLIALVAFSTSVAADNNTTTNVSETPAANVSVPPVTTPLGGDMRIVGRVMDRLPDESLVPLEDVKVTATVAGDITAVLGSTTTKSDGYFTIDVPSKIIVDLTFTKEDYKDRSEEGIDLTEYEAGDTYNMETIFMTSQVTELPNLRVEVRDYVTGERVGDFNKKNTTVEGTAAGIECHVPDVWVEVRDLTGNIIDAKFTEKGIAIFRIPPAKYSTVNVFANSENNEWYMPNVDKPKYYVPWIEPGSESGVSIYPADTSQALIYVGVYEPPIHRLTVDAVTDGFDKRIEVNTAENVTASVTGDYTYNGKTVTEKIPHAIVSVTGAGVKNVPTQKTDVSGKVTFTNVIPTQNAAETITVRAAKPTCFVEDTDKISVVLFGCALIVIKPVDAENEDNAIQTTAVALFNKDGYMITEPTSGNINFIEDNGNGDSDGTLGVIRIETSHINSSLAIDNGPFYLEVVDRAKPNYNAYREHGIDLSAQLVCRDPPKQKTAPMTIT